MKHIAPHLLAQFSAQKTNPKATDRIEAHLETCSACKHSLSKIRIGRDTMKEIQAMGAPDLGWDHIATRIYWTTSSERRAKSNVQKRNWRRPVMALAALVIVAGVGVAFMGGNTEEAQGVATQAPLPQKDLVAADAAPAAIQPDESIGETIYGVVTFMQGEVVDGSQPILFDQDIVKGSHFSTGEGSLVVQFGKRSSFRLAKHSELWVRAFDTHRIELSVVGQVDVDIEKRGPEQAFVVDVGQQSVVVQGTAFRVEYREGQLGVSCTRGKVVVTDGQDNVHVPAGQMFSVESSQWDEAALRAIEIPLSRRSALDAEMAMPLLSTWGEAHQRNLDLSAVLEVVAPETQTVAIDGIRVGKGAFWLRTTIGRHQIAKLQKDGSLRDAAWVDAQGGESPSTVKFAQSVGSRSMRKVRKRELQGAIESGQKARRCLAPLAKRGLMVGSYIEFHVGINTDGRQRFLNIVDSNLSPAIQRCLRGAVDSETLSPGAASEFRLKLSF